MDGGFAKCRSIDSKFGGRTEFALAHRRVDETVASWWKEESTAKGITTPSWADLKQFLRTRFWEKSKELDKVVSSEDVVPLSGLNLQLKKVQGDACMTVDRG